jgi:thiol-activated cytolysin
MKRPALFCLTALLLAAPRPARAADVDVDTYMKGIQFKPEEVLAVKTEGQTAAVKEEKETVGKQGAKLIVTTLTPRSLDKNFDDIAILDPSEKVIYPGALVKVNPLLVQGAPQALTQLYGSADRNVILNIDLPGLEAEEKSKLVEKPQYGNVQTTIDKMTTAWLDKYAKDAKDRDKERTTILARMQSFESVMHSEQQMAADLGLAVDTSKVSIDSKFKLDKTSSRKLAVMVFKQTFYTVSVNQPRTPADYLGKTASEQVLRDNITAKAPPGYVHSVSYGRILMVRIESESDTTDAEMKLMCNYAKGGAKIEAQAETRYKNIFKKTVIHTLAIGGGAEKAAELTAASLEDLPGKVKQFINENANFTKDNRGAPIAYTVYFLGGHNGGESNAHVLAKMSLHTNYTTSKIEEFAEGLIVVDNKGWYTARVRLTYDEYRQEKGKWGWYPQSVTKEGLTLGTKFSHALSPRSSNVKLIVDHASGAVSGLESRTWDTAPRVKFTTYGWLGDSYADPKDGSAP